MATHSSRQRITPIRRRWPTAARRVLVVSILVAIAGVARAQGNSGKTLVVGSEEDYPPFAIGQTDESAGGFTVDLWKTVAAEQGLQFALRVRPFRQILDEFKAGKIDVLINLAQSDERRGFADFSVPHVIVHGAIFVRAGETNIDAEADLAGKSVIVISADLAHDYAVSKGWAPRLVLVDNAADGLKLLASGQHDAMLLSKLAGLQTLQGLRIRNVEALAARAGFSQKFAFAVQKGNAELLAQVNEGLAVAKSSGAYDSLYEKWFGVFEVRQVRLRHLLKYLGPIAIALLIATAVFLVRQHERRKGEQRLRESEERLRLAMSAAQQGLYDLNVQTGECIVSPDYATMLGYDPAEFHETNAAWRERLHPDDRETCFAAYSDYVAGRRSEYRVEFRQRTRDGSWIWVLSLGSLTARSADGQPLRMLGTHTDITKRKLAEDALEHSEERFRTLTESAPILIYLTDDKGDCIYVNRRWCEAAGMTPAEAAGKGWLNGLHEDDRATIGEQWTKAVQSGGAWGFEYRFKTPAGAVTWVYGTAAPIRAANGTVVGFVGTNTDITDRRQAAIEREQFDRKMQETQKLESLGVLAGGIAHDFNNLLTSILGNASIASLELPPGSPVHDSIEQINEASLRAADLCKQMLAYSGRGRFMAQKLDLGELVEQTAQMLQISISKKAVLRFRIEKGLPPIEVDATQIRQVIMNLVINASEAIGDTSGVISLSTGLTRVDHSYLHGTLMDPDLPEGDCVCLEVSDSGCGMSVETRARMFDPFFTTKFTGRGLGLAAVLGIVRGHKGAIKVYSELGRGTTFKLLFPAAAGASDTAPTRSARGTSWQGKGTVLVVDDVESMRSTVARMMRVIGFDPVLAADGREAVEVFRAQPERFDLVLLDLTMPHMDGEQTFTELRRLRPDARVVLMSGFNAHEALLRFPDRGLAGFLQKPFTIASLSATMREVLDGDGTA